MIHPHTHLRYIRPEVGHGVVATARIPQGTITWARDPMDREIPPAEMEALPAMCREQLLTYCYRNAHGNFMFCWDHGRYLNHSFHPNCLPTPFGFEVAVRDIEAGEELTNDYGTLNLLEPFRAADEGTRRKWVYPDDLVRHHQAWDRQLASALRRFPEVEQPLRPLVEDRIWTICLEAASGKRNLPSILELYCTGPATR